MVLLILNVCIFLILLSYTILHFIKKKINEELRKSEEALNHYIYNLDQSNKEKIK